MRRVGQAESCERCGHAYGDIAPPGGASEESGQNLIGTEGQKDNAGGTQGLHESDGEWTQRKYELPESERGCKPNQKDRDGRDHSDAECDRWCIRSVAIEMQCGGGQREYEPGCEQPSANFGVFGHDKSP